MLIHLLRVVFVILAVFIANKSGQYFYKEAFEGSMPWWTAAVIGFGVAVTLIAAEQAFRRHFTRSLVAFLIGLGGGLALSYLILSVLRLVLQDENLYRNLDAPIALLTTYLVLMTVLRSVDRVRLVIPFVELRAERAEGGAGVLDARLLSDGRLLGVVQSGLLPGRLLVHRSVLLFWEDEAQSGDAARTVRARRALGALAELRALGRPNLDIDESDLPGATDLDDKLLRLARLEGGRLITADALLARRAAAQGVAVIDLSVLTAALAPTVKPGEVLNVIIEKLGEGRAQGVGHLDDGSLVVVNGAADDLGKNVACTVLRIHATANGRMVFADKNG